MNKLWESGLSCLNTLWKGEFFRLVGWLSVIPKKLNIFRGKLSEMEEWVWKKCGRFVTVFGCAQEHNFETNSVCIVTQYATVPCLMTCVASQRKSWAEAQRQFNSPAGSAALTMREAFCGSSSLRLLCNFQLLPQFGQNSADSSLLTTQTGSNPCPCSSVQSSSPARRDSGWLCN